VELNPRTGGVNGRLWGARAGDWANIQERTGRPIAEAVLERTRVTSCTRYLDLGCGAGMAAQMAATRGAHVWGIDAAEELLAIARGRTPEGDFRWADLEELPFEDHSFDVVTGLNSMQYAGNPLVALREARRVARPDGAVAAVRPLMPPPLPGAPGPFALSYEQALRKFAAAAALTPVEIFDIESPFVYPDEGTAIRGLNSSGVRYAPSNTRASRP
jgi:ubiquinone/menaquinone biosynthesis C-methylase UbiE